MYFQFLQNNFTQPFILSVKKASQQTDDMPQCLPNRLHWVYSHARTGNIFFEIHVLFDVSLDK
jgi:hypothetical protein